VFFSKPVGKATQVTGLEGGTREKLPPDRMKLTAFHQASAGFFAERKETKGTKKREDGTGVLLRVPRMFLPY